MKNRRRRIQFGKQINKLPYFCIEGCQRLVKYVNESDGNCLDYLCNTENYNFINIKLILGWILLRSAKQSDLPL